VLGPLTLSFVLCDFHDAQIEQNLLPYLVVLHEEEECSCVAIQSRYSDNGSYIGSSREHEQRGAVGKPEEENYTPNGAWDPISEIRARHVQLWDCETYHWQ